MKVTPDQVRSRIKVGTLDKKPVFLIETYGGYNIVESEGEPIATGSNSGIAKGMARKENPNIEFEETSTSLSKSMNNPFTKAIAYVLLRKAEKLAKEDPNKTKIATPPKHDPNATQVVKPNSSSEVKNPDIKVRSWADDKPKPPITRPSQANFRHQAVALAYKNAFSKDKGVRQLAREKLKGTDKLERKGHQTVIRAGGKFATAKPKQ